MAGTPQPPQTVGSMLEVGRVLLSATVFLVIFARVILTGTPPSGASSEETLVREFQLCTIVVLALYFTLSFGIVLFAQSHAMLFLRARFFETILIPALAILLYSHWNLEHGLPPVQESEDCLVRQRLSLFLVAVVLEMLQTYHVQQSSAENLVGIGFLGIAFAFAVAQKYQESFPGAIVPVATLVYPPSIVGLLVYGMIQGQLWHVPAGDLLLQHEVASQEEGAGDGDELFSDDGDNDDGESEEDDEELARRLQNEDVPQELRVDSPGSRTISPIATEQRLRSRKPVVYRS